MVLLTVCVGCRRRVPLLPDSPYSYQGGNPASPGGGADVFRPADAQESGTPMERVLFHVIMMLVNTALSHSPPHNAAVNPFPLTVCGRAMDRCRATVR